MNPFLKNEISWLVGFTAGALALAGKPKWARRVGFAALGLRLLPLPTSSIKSKTVVITGGSRGLGLALAEEFLRGRARVALLARDPEELRRARASLSRFSSTPVLIISCDVTNKEELECALREVESKFRSIDVLVNNAGSISVGPLAAMESEDFDAQMKLHFHATRYACELVLPRFLATGSGHIVNISSIGGKFGVPHLGPYSASKFAMAGYSQTLAAEVQNRGIKVTTVYPGLMRTGSPIQAVFKGDHMKEFAWFALSDNAAGISISAQNAARQIVRAMRGGAREIVLSVPAKFGVFMHEMFPEIFGTIMALSNRALPSGVSRERFTGAESRSWLESKIWGQPFAQMQKQNERRYNQREKFNADFNMGIGNVGIPNQRF